MKEFESIRKDIKSKKYSPLYFFFGDEPFFIDKLTQLLQDTVLSEQEKAFNEHVFYGNDTSIKDVIMQARQFPMMSEYQLVVVKEAQHLNKQWDDLQTYIEQPLGSTILVFNYKYGKPDGRHSAIKKIKKNFVYAESPRLRDYQIPDYIEKIARGLGLDLDPKAKFLLAENIGDNMSRMHNEIEKLSIVLKDEKVITPAVVEKHIGISKDYNNFELTKAISQKNVKRSFEIIKYFGQNPKDNPIFFTMAVLFNYFSKLLQYHALTDKSKGNVAKTLKINPFFVKDYVDGARHFPVKKVTQIISLLRDTDMKAKGVGATNHVSHEELLREFLYKIYTL